MNPAFPARLPLKMFHCVRDINLRSINPSFLKRLIHDFASGSNERFTSDILVVSWLFTHEHHRCALWTFAKHSLRRPFIKMACLAIFCRLAHRRPARGVGWLGRAGKLLI